jgi:hypothetical protein
VKFNTFYLMRFPNDKYGKVIDGKVVESENATLFTEAAVRDDWIAAFPDLQLIPMVRLKPPIDK